MIEGLIIRVYISSGILDVMDVTAAAIVCQWFSKRGRKERRVFIRPIFFALLLSFGFSGIVFSAPPERIVSLAPAITEILYELGLDDRIVAVTAYCDYPPQAATKPKVGGFSNPSLEAIIAARPDMVVMADEGNPLAIYRRLKKLGINTYVFRAKRLKELPQAMRAMGSAFGVEKRASERADRIEKVIRSYEKELKMLPAGRFKKAMFVVQPEPLIIAGSGTVIDDALNLLGMKNIASDAVARYPKYSLEEVIHRSPDIIFVGKGRMTGESAGNLVRRLKGLAAIQKGHVCYMSEALYKLTPRVVDGIEEMAKCLEKP
jgi:iron complex transport system substrate-binding protein